MAAVGTNDTVVSDRILFQAIDPWYMNWEGHAKGTGIMAKSVWSGTESSHLPNIKLTYSQ